MTDNETIRALEEALRSADETINRQKAEISVKNKLLDIAEEKFKTIKAEAYKELTERTKERIKAFLSYEDNYHDMSKKLLNTIANLEKEMLGEV